ncbi:hypothetical protein JKP88DRAFT_261459 [Tribonema minus]|uniref:Uncharacterized protein n=1 Tax=Tribonema minus TaxID=303371 RepID=A0A835YLJ2_9STRA|nr:hypothetical protein JKP88DRAFT_261459 [Tribonema minus]
MASPGAFHHSLWSQPGKSVESVLDEVEELRQVPPDISAAIECFHGNSVTTVTGGGTGETRIVASHLSASGTGSNFAIGGHRRRQQRTIAELPVMTFSAVHKFSFENWRDGSAPPLEPSEGARRPVLLTLRVRVIYVDAATQAAYDAMCRDLHHAHYKDDDSYKFVWRNELAGDRMPAQVLALPSCGSAWLSWPVYLLSVLTLTHGVLHFALDKWVSKRVYFITKEVRAGPGTAF